MAQRSGGRIARSVVALDGYHSRIARSYASIGLNEVQSILDA